MGKEHDVVHTANSNVTGMMRFRSREMSVNRLVSGLHFTPCSFVIRFVALNTRSKPTKSEHRCAAVNVMCSFD